MSFNDMPKLGFGLMRLPKKDGAIDMEAVQKMVDAYSLFDPWRQRPGRYGSQGSSGRTGS